MSDTDTVLAALGGNALQDPADRGTYDQQIDRVDRTAEVLADVLEAGTDLVLTHGNGPQIGDIYRRNLTAAEVVPPMPLFACGAQSQGLIGFMIQSALASTVADRGLDADCVPLVTPVYVDGDDPAFENPTKPIGPFLSESEAADVEATMDAELKEFPDRGYRQVVPSPEPVSIYGVETVRAVLERGDVPVVAGGGGVPVVESESGRLEGVDAVVDKDLTGAQLGEQLDADVFLILTDVPQVALNYGEPDQTDLEEITPEQARSHMDEGHFERGSMYEKVEAACRFVESGNGRRSVITKLDLAKEALTGDAGTQIHPDA